jgi:Acyl-CoA carboxylase epsilon subunit
VSGEETSAPVVPTEPALRVVRGDPDPTELAALVAVVAAAASSAVAPPPHGRSAWATRDRAVRTSLTTGGWRRSLDPR